MSKNSAKQLYTQTMEWLGTMNIQRKKRSKKPLSKLEYYEQKQKR